MTYTRGRQRAHCPFCGHRYAVNADWPRDCTGCGETNWLNPVPVAVVLVPVRGVDGAGLVAVRRNIEPGRGELALPGGYVEVGESWQEAAVRELREETGLAASPADVRLFDVVSGRGTIEIFAILPIRPAASLPLTIGTDGEVVDWCVLPGPARLAFPAHTAAAAAFFSSRAG